MTEKLVLALELTDAEAKILYAGARKRLETTEHWLRNEAHRYRSGNTYVAALRTEVGLLRRILQQLEPPPIVKGEAPR